MCRAREGQRPVRSYSCARKYLRCAAPSQPSRHNSRLVQLECQIQSLRDKARLATIIESVGSSIVPHYTGYIALPQTTTFLPHLAPCVLAILCCNCLLFLQLPDMSLSLTPEAAVVQGMGAGVVPVTVTEAANRAVVFIETRCAHTH